MENLGAEFVKILIFSKNELKNKFQNFQKFGYHISVTGKFIH